MTPDQTPGGKKKVQLTLVHPDDLRTDKGIKQFLDHLEGLGFKFKDETKPRASGKGKSSRKRKKRASA
jgi:hypothetical protein